MGLRWEVRELRVVAGEPGREGMTLVVPRAVVELSLVGLVRLPWRAVRLRRASLYGARLEVDGTYRLPPAEAGTPWSLRLDELEVADGFLRFDRRDWPLHLVARDVALDGAWDREAEAVSGELRATAEIERPPLREPLVLSVAGGVSLGLREVRLKGARVDAPGLHGEGEVRLNVGGGPFVVGDGEIDVDLTRASELLDGTLPELAGRLRGPLQFEAGPGPLTLRGKLRAEDGRFGKLRIDTAEAAARYVGGVVELRSLRASTLEGRVVGEGELRLRDEPSFRAALVAEGISAAALLDWVGTRLPLAARLDGGLDLEGLIETPGSWTGTGRFDASPPTTARTRGLPVGGPGRLRFEAGRLLLDSERLALASGRFAAHLGLDLEEPRSGTLELDGPFADAARLRDALSGVAHALEIDLPELLGRSIAGAGALDATVGIGGVPTWSVGLVLSEGASWSGRAFDHAEARIARVGERLTWADAQLRTGEGSLSSAGAWTLADDFPERLELSLRDLPTPWLVEALGLPLDPGGLVSGEVRDGAGRLRLRDGEVAGIPIREAVSEVRMSGAGLALTELTVSSPPGTARGTFRYASGEGALLLDHARLELDALAELVPGDLTVSGQADVRGAFRLRGGEWDGEGSLLLLEPEWTGYRFADAQGDFALEHGALTLNLQGSAGDSFRAGTTVTLADPFPFEARVSLRGAELELGRSGVEAAVRAALSGEAAAAGELARPAATRLEAEVTDAAVEMGVKRFEAAAPFSVELEGGVLSLPSLRFVGTHSDLRAQVAYDFNRDHLDAGAGGYVDLGLVSALRGDLRGEGRVDVAAQVVGTLAAPSYSGALRTTDAHLRWLGFSQPLDRVAFTILLDRQHATISEVRARMGNGELRGSGEIGLSGLSPDRFEGEIEGANVQLRWPAGFRGIYEGRLAWSADSDDARIRGRIEMLRGVYEREFDLATGLGEGEDDLPDLKLDVDLVSGGNLRVRNDLAHLDAEMDLHVGGTLASPEVTGRIRALEGGTLEYRDVEYRVRSASLDFLDVDRLDPYLTLRADTQVDEYTVFLTVEGRLDSIDYRVQSEPPLDPTDIIAVLTAGRTLEQIDDRTGARDAGFTKDLAAAYFGGVLTQPLERELKRVLGLSRIRIDPLLLNGSADPTARVTLGEEVLDDVFVIVSADLGGDRERQLYQVEWRATPKVGFTAERDNLGGVGGSVRYVDRFWWNPPERRRTHPLPEEEVAPHPAPVGPAIRAIEWAGIEGDLRRRVAEGLPLRLGQPFSRSAMFRGVEHVRARLVSAGRIEAAVDAEHRVEDGGVTIRYEVDPGPRVRLRLQGAPDRQLRRLEPDLRTFWGESVFREDLYVDAAERIRSFFHELGYYTVDVHWSTEREGDGRAVVFEIERGEIVRVERIEIDAGATIERERIEEVMRLVDRGAFGRRTLIPEDVERDRAAIRALFRSEGYLSVSVPPPRIRLDPEGKTASVAFAIEAGPRSRVAAATYPDAAGYPAERLAAWAALPAGAVYSPAALRAAENRLRAAFDERGYPEADVRGRAEGVEKEVRVSFDVRPGPERRVGAIRIERRGRTDERIVRRELELSAGDPLSRRRLLEAQHRLYRLGLFRSVRVQSVCDDAESAACRVEVVLEEAPPLTTSAALGYDSEAKARLNFSLTNNNLGGRDRVLGFQGRFSGLERRLALLAEEPRMFGKRLPGLLNVRWQRQDQTSFSEERLGGALRVDRRFNERWTGYARLGLDRVDLRDIEDPEAVTLEKLEDLRLGSIGAAAVRSTLDSPFRPTGGSRVRLSLDVFSEALLSEAEFVVATGEWARVRTFAERHTLAGALRLGLSSPFAATDRVPISERFFAGGDSTLRGFPRDRVGPRTTAGTPLGGEALLLWNVEYRFPVWSALRGVLFYDVGNVYEKIGDLDPTDVRHVLGAGLRFETPIGPFRLEYGRKLRPRSGESTGELYLAIGNPF